MTIGSVYEPVQYTGNGVTTAFTFPYTFYQNSDLIVTLTLISTGVDTLQTINTDYTVTGGMGSSGTVTMVTAPSSLYRLTIARELPYLQSSDYVENQAFPADTLESDFDKSVILSQQLKSRVDLCLKYPDTLSGITNAVLPQPEDGKALVFNGATGEIVTSSDYIADAVSDATAAATGTNLITATSTTSLSVTTTGEKIWTIQEGRGFALGQRLRAASDDGTKINEGAVTAYSGASLTINVDYTSGSGTHADWNIGVTGIRGASGVGSGDMLAANNLSDVASVSTAFNTIKQAATETYTGVVELATTAEVVAGTDTARAVTCAGVAAALAGAGVMVVGSLVSATGTAVDITSIPATAKKITINFSGVSTNGTDTWRIQIGDSGGIETSGYLAAGSEMGGATTSLNDTAGFPIRINQASSIAHGSLTLTLMNSGTNLWAMSGVVALSSSAVTLTCAGTKSLSATLDRIRLTTTGGTNTFDAGNINIVYET